MAPSVGGDWHEQYRQGYEFGSPIDFYVVLFDMIIGVILLDRSRRFKKGGSGGSKESGLF